VRKHIQIHTLVTLRYKPHFQFMQEAWFHFSVNIDNLQ